MTERKDVSAKKDVWDKVTAFAGIISTGILGFITVYLTHLDSRYGQLLAAKQEEDQQAQAARQLAEVHYQNRVQEMQAVEKFFPHLVKGNHAEREFAIIAISVLGSAEVATQ